MSLRLKRISNVLDHKEQKMRRSLIAVSLASVLVGSFSLTGCSGGGSSSGDGSSVEAPKSLDLRLQVGTETIARNFKRAALGTPADIVAVTIDAVNVDGSVYAKGLPLSKEGGVWSVELKDLPLNASINFDAKAYNSSDVVIYEGNFHGKQFTSVEESLHINLFAKGDGVDVSIPQLTKVEHLDGLIRFHVSDAGDYDVAYTITPDSNAGVFGTTQDVVTLSSGSGVFDINYTESENVGTFTHKIELNNQIGGVLKAEFSTRIISRSNIELGIAPVITELTLERQGNTLISSAEVYDDENTSTLSYLWDFTNTSGATIVDNSVNPATITGFSDTTDGELNITVTDQRGLSSSLAYTIVPNQFPDITAPVIASTVPAHNGVLLSNQGISVTFSEAMERGSIDSDSFFISDGIRKLTGSFSFSNDDKTVTFTPDSALDVNGSYIATVNVNVKDTSGNHLANDETLVWEFTVRQPVAVPTSGLVSHWTMDNQDGTTLYDEKNRVNGTIEGVTFVDGKFGKAMRMEGSQHTDSNINPISGLAAFTTCYWIKPLETIEVSAIVNIWGQSPRGQATFLYQDKIATDIHGNSGMRAPNALVVGEWFHYCASYTANGNVMKLYIDGSLVEDAYPSTVPFPSEPDYDYGMPYYSALFGDDYTGHENDSAIALDEVRLYDRVLSPEEIQALANQ